MTKVFNSFFLRQNVRKSFPLYYINLKRLSNLLNFYRSLDVQERDARASMGDYTNWEMHTIWNNPSLLSKTTFYTDWGDGDGYEVYSGYSPY